MSSALTIAVTDACGSHRSFQADRASLDCGAGLLEFKAGCPTFYRKFDEAVLTIFHSAGFHPAGATLVKLHNCTASLASDALHILCEDFQEEPGDDRSAGLKSLPDGCPAASESSSH